MINRLYLIGIEQQKIKPLLLKGAPSLQQEDNGRNSQNQESYSEGANTGRANLLNGRACRRHLVQYLEHLQQQKSINSDLNQVFDVKQHCSAL